MYIEDRRHGRVTVMHADRPGPGEELNPGPPATPRPAATVIIVRRGDAPLEVLLVQRNPVARFMAGAWVFPGGAVDAHDGEGDLALRAAAVREVAEEAGIALPSRAALVPFSRWITPAQVRTRFDTWFYLALAPAGAEPTVDGQEIVTWRWYEPQAALAAARAGEILLVFPTIKHLEQISVFATGQELLAHTRGRDVRPVEPRVLMSGEMARIVLPGEPGYSS
jgi:8-oxo-dGTP pyrophosphatase MutT (NUDIX family)